MGGSIIPMQISTTGPAMTTGEVQSAPITLLVALNAALLAYGDLYLDDGGISDNSQAYTQAHFDIIGASLVSSIVNNDYILDTAILTSVEIYGVATTQSSCDVVLVSPSKTIRASSAEIVTLPNYKKLVISFDPETAINVASPFTMSWDCSDSSSSDSASNDDGFASLPVYAQALIVIASILGGLGCIACFYFSYRFQQQKKEGGEEPMLGKLL